MLSPFDRSKLKIKRQTWDNEERPRVDIVAAYEALTGNKTRRSGKANVALCPFHGENHPSFALYDETSSYFCFSCGEHGDAFNLIMHLKEVNFREALEIGKQYER